MSYAPKLTKNDGRVDWTRSASEVRNRIRGLTPWPGASCRFVGQDRTDEVTILRAAPGGIGEESLPPGTVLGADDREGIVVQTGEGAIVVERLKPASGRAMTAADFVHGRRVQRGDRLE